MFIVASVHQLHITSMPLLPLHSGVVKSPFLQGFAKGKTEFVTSLQLTKNLCYAVSIFFLRPKFGESNYC